MPNKRNKQGIDLAGKNTQQKKLGARKSVRYVPLLSANLQ